MSNLLDLAVALGGSQERIEKAVSEQTLGQRAQKQLHDGSGAIDAARYLAEVHFLPAVELGHDVVDLCGVGRNAKQPFVLQSEATQIIKGQKQGQRNGKVEVERAGHRLFQSHIEQGCVMAGSCGRWWRW